MILWIDKKGIVTFVWFIFWCYFAYNSPPVHPRCSPAERAFLAASLPKPKKVKDDILIPHWIVHFFSISVQLKTPWSAIARSITFWSIAVAITCVQFVYYVLLTSLPTYFATILRFNLQKVYLRLSLFSSRNFFSIEWSYVCNSLYIFVDRHCD